MKRENNESNVNFLLEEIAVAHIIRENLIEFPKVLVQKDSYRLIVYPGPVLKAEAYVWKNKILPQKNIKLLGRYYNSTYDPVKKELYRFGEFVFD